MKENRIKILLVCILCLSLQVKAHDSITYQGKRYKLYKEPTKSYIVTFSDTIRFVAEAYPHYPGGVQSMYKYISKNLRYPSKARKDKVQGRVIVGFIVNTQGRTDSISVIESIRYDLDQAAIEVIQNMPAWQPGTQDQKPVNVRLSIPIDFKL